MGQRLRDFRGYAIVTIVAATGVLTPPNPSSLFAWVVPAIWLYQGAILATDS
jgi:Sec-independent protein secretion pathway component TatC